MSMVILMMILFWLSHSLYDKWHQCNECPPDGAKKGKIKVLKLQGFQLLWLHELEGSILVLQPFHDARLL